MKRVYDAIIIGGGVLGNSCALELSRRGLKTLTIESNSAAGWGSTSSSSSIVRVFYSAMDSCKLAWEGYHGWQHWGEHLQSPPGEALASFRRTGALILDYPGSASNAVYLDRVTAAMQRLDIEHEYWNREELSCCMPYISTASYNPPRRIEDDQFGEPSGKLAGALYTPHTGSGPSP